jgi:hypothetical protein
LELNYYRDKINLDIDAPFKVSTTAEGHVVESYKVNDKPGYFVTLAGTHWCAHGASLAEAIADAIWKDPKRRPTLEALKMEICVEGKDRKISLREFRVLTGACSEGCKIELQRAGLDGSPMLAKDIVKHFPEWGKKLLIVLEWDK